MQTSCQKEKTIKTIGYNFIPELRVIIRGANLTLGGNFLPIGERVQDGALVQRLKKSHLYAKVLNNLNLLLTKAAYSVPSY